MNHRVALSLRWSALGEICSRAISPLTLVVLARLVSPHDFGLVAIATIVVSFAQMLWDAGLGRALIQSEEQLDQVANVAFWINTMLGVCVYGLIFCFAEELADLLGEPAAGAIVRVAGLQVLIGALGSVQQALCTRELEFRRLFVVKITATLIPCITSIALAFKGLGVWALLGGTLAGQVASTVMLWSRSTWRPSRSFNRQIAARVIPFGAWVAFEGLGAWFFLWGDSVAVGQNLGAYDLGVYRTGTALVMVVFATVLSPILPVAYPVLSRLQRTPEAARATFLEMNALLVVMATALAGGLFLVGPMIETVLFGSKWSGIGWVISVFGLGTGVSWMVALNAELYRAMGRPDINTKVMYLQLLYYLPAYWIGAKEGLAVFCLVRLALTITSVPIHLALATRLLGFEGVYLLKLARIALLPCAAMAVSVFVLQRSICQEWGVISLTLQAAVGAAVFGVTIFASDRGFFSKLITVISGRSPAD